MNQTPPTHIGIDVSKAILDVHIPGQPHFRVNRDRAGLDDLFDRLSSISTPHIVCESTAGYQRALVEAAFSRGVSISVVMPLRVRQFGNSMGLMAKTDRIDAVLLSGLEAGWPRQNLHSERFLAPPTGQPFKIFLEKSQISITVGEHQSVLEAIEAAGIDAPYMCRGGACGQCETGVSSCDGELQHNDIYLSDEEKQAGTKIMICVSRFKGQQLVLQL